MKTQIFSLYTSDGHKKWVYGIWDKYQNWLQMLDEYLRFS